MTPISQTQDNYPQVQVCYFLGHFDLPRQEKMVQFCQPPLKFFKKFHFFLFPTCCISILSIFQAKCNETIQKLVFWLILEGFRAFFGGLGTQFWGLRCLNLAFIWLFLLNFTLLHNQIDEYKQEILFPMHIEHIAPQKRPLGGFRGPLEPPKS